jgi:hypothetical protein
MFANNIESIGDQGAIVLSHHLVTNIDFSKLETSTFLLLIASICVVLFSIFNIVYIYYNYEHLKEKFIFRAIPNYFKALTNKQRIEQLDNEMYYRSYGFDQLDDKAYKRL